MLANNFTATPVREQARSYKLSLCPMLLLPFHHTLQDFFARGRQEFRQVDAIAVMSDAVGAVQAAETDGLQLCFGITGK